MAINEVQPTSAESKTPRIRSVAYPSLTVVDSIDVTNNIYKIFGNTTYTPRETIAKQLHISESHLQTQVSSCVQFGLLELKAKEGYKPTELFIKVRSPLPEENVDDALISIFSNPELYKVIIEQFNGKQLPAQGGLATILYRKHKVAEKVAEFAAGIFIESAIELGFFAEEGDGILRVQRRATSKDHVEIIEEKKDETQQKQIIYVPQSQTNQAKENEENYEIIPFFLDNGAVAKLYMPKGSTKQDFKRIWKILDGYSD